MYICKWFSPSINVQKKQNDCVELHVTRQIPGPRQTHLVYVQEILNVQYTVPPALSEEQKQFTINNKIISVCTILADWLVFCYFFSSVNRTNDCRNFNAKIPYKC